MSITLLVVCIVLSLLIGIYIGRIYQKRVGGAMVYVPVNPRHKKQDSFGAAYGRMRRPEIQVLMPMLLQPEAGNVIRFRTATPVRVRSIFLWGDPEVTIKSIKLCDREELAVGEAPIQVFEPRDREGKVRTYEQLQKELVDFNAILDVTPLVLPIMSPGDELVIEYEGGQVLNTGVWYSGLPVMHSCEEIYFR